MEAKVDVRKLQLLNDRINQTIEALNQVRLSVHGLAQSTPMSPPVTGQQPAGAQPFIGQPYAGTPFIGQPPTSQPFMAQTAWPQAPVGYGLQHTTAVAGLGPLGTVPGALGPSWIGVGMVGGLGHSPIETEVERQIALTRACDPNRVAVTFPYVFSF